VCKYFSNCVWLFVPAGLFSRLSCCCSVSWCQKNFLACSTIGHVWHMIDNELLPKPTMFFFWYTVIVPQENKQNYSSLYLHHELQYNKLEDKNSAPNDSKHSPVLLCSKFLHKWNMDFIDRLLSPHCNIAFLSTPDSFCSWRSRFWFQAGDGSYVWTTE